MRAFRRLQQGKCNDYHSLNKIMSALTVNNVRVAGLSACVPEKVEENLTLSIFENEEEAKKIIASTGIERKHVVDSGTTASDLTVVAVEKMIAELGWEKESIDLLVYVCQSRDYIAPMTSCILQDRLGLSKGCCFWCGMEELQKSEIMFF